MADSIARGDAPAGPVPSLFWPKSSLLGGLPEPTRRRMLELGAGRRFERGRRILAEGERSTFVVLIRAGFVKVSARRDDGRQTLLAIRTRGDLIGELAAIDENPRSGTVVASSPVEAAIIPQGEFLGFLSRHPQANLQFNRMLAYRLRQANRRRLDFTGCSAPVRVSRVLTELIETYGRRTPKGWVCDVPFTQHELADLSGTSVETAQITLRRLRQAGVISTGYRKLTVLDSRTLHGAAHLTS